MKYAAYSLDEIEQKTRSLRESAKYTAGDGVTALDVSIDYFLGFLRFQSSLLILCFDLIGWIVRIILAELDWWAGHWNVVSCYMTCYEFLKFTFVRQIYFWLHFIVCIV